MTKMDEHQVLDQFGQPGYVPEHHQVELEERAEMIGLEVKGYDGELEVFIYASEVEVDDLSKTYNQHKAAELCAQLSCVAQPRAEGTLQAIIGAPIDLDKSDPDRGAVIDMEAVENGIYGLYIDADNRTFYNYKVVNSSITGGIKEPEELREEQPEDFDKAYEHVLSQLSS